MTDAKKIDAAVQLIDVAADVDGLQTAVAALCHVLQHPTAPDTRQNRKALSGLTAAVAKVLSAPASLASAAAADAAFAVWDAVFATVRGLVELNDATRAEHWMHRAFVLRNVGAELTAPERVIVGLQSAAVTGAMVARLTKLYALLFEVIADGEDGGATGAGAGGDGGGGGGGGETAVAASAAVAGARTPQEAKLALDSLVASAVACPTCSVAALSEVLARVLQSPSSDANSSARRPCALAAIQQLITAVSDRQSHDTHAAVSRVLGALHSAVVLLVLPRDWERPLDEAAWATSATLASRLNVAGGGGGPSWADAVVVQFVAAARVALAAAESPPPPLLQADGAATTTTTTAAATTTASSKKAPAPKKPAPKARGKKAAKAEEQQQPPSDHDGDAAPPAAVEACDGGVAPLYAGAATGPAAAAATKRHVLARGLALLDALTSSGIRDLQMGSLCGLAHVVMDLSNDSTATAAASIAVWRQVVSLARVALPLRPSVESTGDDAAQQDQKQQLQSFVDKCCIPAFRRATAHSAALLEATAFFVALCVGRVGVAAASGGADSDAAGGGRLTAVELRRAADLAAAAVGELECAWRSVARVQDVVEKRFSNTAKNNNNNKSNNNNSNNNNNNTVSGKRLASARDQDENEEGGSEAGDEARENGDVTDNEWQSAKLACAASLHAFRGRLVLARSLAQVLTRVADAVSAGGAGGAAVGSSGMHPSWLAQSGSRRH